MSNACSSFAESVFASPLPPRQCWNVRAIDELLLTSDTVKNQHCNGGRGESGICPNRFDKDCSYLKKAGLLQLLFHFAITATEICIAL